jgi:adenylate kinase family enzyme
MKQRIVLLGPDASGKGTQETLLLTAFALSHASILVLFSAQNAHEASLLGNHSIVASVNNSLLI